MKFFILSATFISLTLLMFSTASGEESSLAYLGTDGKLQYGYYANQGETNAVNRLPDFSFCGFMGGGVPIPDVPIAVIVYPSAGDDTQMIQSAIDTVSALTPDGNGFRGAVLLKAGTYHVSSTLYLDTDGVVLRGEGQDELGTIIKGTSPSNYDLIYMGGGSGANIPVLPTMRNITSSYVPSGAKTFQVEDVNGYSVGDMIIVERTPNQYWIDELDMGGWEIPWTIERYTIGHQRYITDINGNTITVETPLVDVMQDLYGGGRIYKTEPISRTRHCGVENLRLVSNYAYDTDEEHPWIAVRVQFAEDCWVRGVTAQYFALSAVHITVHSRWITVEDCAFIEAKSEVTGGRRYSFFAGDSVTWCLFQRCYSSESRHDFIINVRTRGPNAFVDCYAVNSYNDSGPHSSWATGTLFDNVYTSNILAVENRAHLGSGHGWSGAQTVFWNCRADMGQKCDAPKGGMNFAIGSSATKMEGSWASEPFGWWEHQWQTVTPRSLYYQQLSDRLGHQAVDAVTLSSQQAGRIWSELAEWEGKDRFQTPPIKTNTPVDYPLIVGVPAAFEVIAEPGANVTEYQWYEVTDGDYGPIGTDSSFLVISSVLPSDYGRKFFCRVVTDKGPYWSRTAVLGTKNVSPEVVIINNWSEITEYGNDNNRVHQFYDNWYGETAPHSTQFQVWPASWYGGDNIAVFRKSYSADLVYRELEGPEKIGVDETKTFFFRFLAEDEGADQSIGLTGVTVPTGENSFRVQLINRHGDFGVRHGGQDLLVDIDTGTSNPLYNVWVVVNNDTDTFKVYMNQNDVHGLSAGAMETDRLVIGGTDTFNFRTGQTAATVRLMLHAYDGINYQGKVWYDDIYMMEGENLSNPILEFALLSDLNDNGTVELADLKILCDQWLTDGDSSPSADIDFNSWVDLKDFSIMIDNWMVSK